MHLGRVKNYIIVILITANLISGALLAWKYYTTYTVERQAKTELLALLDERGVAVSALPDITERVYVLERDLNAEKTAVEAVLGACSQSDMGGGIYLYQGESGTAQLRSGGRFEILLENGAVFEDFESACRSMMSGMGLFNGTAEYDESDLDGGGKLLIFGQTNNKSPIFNAKAVFEFTSGGQLKSVSGLWMFAVPKLAEGAECKSAGSVLLTFAGSLEQKLAVESMQLGFRLKTIAPGISSLTPEWRVLGGGECYYLDALNGQTVTPEE